MDGNVNAPAEDEGEGSLEAPEGEGVECGCCFGEYQFVSCAAVSRSFLPG